MNNIVVNNDIIFDALGLVVRDKFECLSIGHVGFNCHERNKMLAFCESERYLSHINKQSITAVLCPDNLAVKIRSFGKVAIVSKDAKNDFQRMRDYLARKNYKKYPSIIHPSVKLPPLSFVSDYNVFIDEGVIIEPNVTILPDVRIGAESFICSGSVLGASFDAKISKSGNLSNNFHDGKLIIGKRVKIHSCCVLDKGNSFHGDTIIEDDCKIGHQSCIGHSSIIGAKSFVMARVAIAGGVRIGKLVTIDPGVCICSYVKIGDRARITTGSVVAYDVAPYARMSGNFAVSHERFMEKFKPDAFQ